MISFNWDIHLACNYKCPYCWWFGKEEEIKRKNFYVAIDEVIKAWKRIYDKYGMVNLSITGGEPFLYPNFDKFLIEVSKLHKILVITNLEFFKGDLLEKIEFKENLNINPSFHPLSANIDQFIEKVKILEKYNILQAISLVAYPIFIKDIDKYKRIFKERGCNHNISLQPYNGIFNNKTYPDSYTEEERKIIGLSVGNRGGENFVMKTFSPKGKKCNAGRTYGQISPKGDVKKCGGWSEGEDVFIGNIFDPNFKMLEKSSVCNCYKCVENEWAFLLDKEEQNK